MPLGRGGSGNFWEAQREKEVAKEDVEAQLSQQRDEIAEIQANASAPAEYAYRARGGAGNVYSPRELAATGRFESGTTTSKLATASSASQVTPPVRMSGRGGAGNFSYAAVQADKDAKQAQTEQDEKIQRIQAEVSQGVEAQLAFPAKARVPGEKAE